MGQFRMWFSMLLVIGMFLFTVACSSNEEAQTGGSKRLNTNPTTSGTVGTTTPNNSANAQGQIFPSGVGKATSNGAFLVKVDWTSGPAVGSESKARLTFATSNRAMPGGVASVTFKGIMPSMGHGLSASKLSVQRDSTAANVYVVGGIYFAMGGDWDLTIGAKVDNAPGSLVISTSVR